MNYNEAIKFIDKSSLKAMHYKNDVNVISKKTAYVLASVMFESNTCRNCKYLDKDTGKSYSKCEELEINIGHEMLLSFYCSEWSEK